MSPFAIIALVLILARVVTELWLSRLNQRHVRERANEVPPAFRGIIDEATYRRSVDYTLAKSRFGDIVNVFDAVVLIALLFSGLLPWAFGRFSATLGTSVLAMAGFLFLTGIALSIPSLPFAWYAQFKLEERFGFNTTSMKTWIARSSQRISARGVAWLSVACAGVETDRVDWHKLVDLGGGGCHRVPIASAAHRAGNHHAAFQQVHAAAGRSVARTPLCTGAAHPFSHAQHRSDGRQ